MNQTRLAHPDCVVCQRRLAYATKKRETRKTTKTCYDCGADTDGATRCVDCAADHSHKQGLRNKDTRGGL